MLRALKAGGHVVLLEPARDAFVGRAVREGMDPRFLISMVLWRIVSGRAGRFSQESLRELMTRAGFEGRGDHPDARRPGPARGRPQAMNAPSAASEVRSSRVPTVAWVSLGVLTTINLLNYLDSVRGRGDPAELQGGLCIPDSEAGYLQSAFLISYIACSPVSGYLGDRIPRKYLIAVGVGVWSIATLASAGLSGTPAPPHRPRVPSGSARRVMPPRTALIPRTSSAATAAGRC